MSAEQSAKPIETGEIEVQVSRDIVSHLSFGIYKNFARAIRELISNSYDARATEIRIGLDLESNPPRVVVRDNGVGMDKNDMENRLFRLGNVTPFTDNLDDLGRKRIGQFGIGFLSTFPYCERVVVTSKKEKEDTIIEVSAETSAFFQGETFNVTDYKAPFSKYNSDLPIEKGETIVTLESIKPHIVKQLQRTRSQRSKASIESFDGYEKFKWTIAQFAPISFPPDRTDLREYFEVKGRTPLRVWLDGEELFRNVPADAEILQKGEQSFDNIDVKYVIMTPNKPVQPEEARGLQIRVCDVGIGLPTDFDVIKLRSRNLGRLYYLCGEVQILKGIVPVKIDRDSLSWTESVEKMEIFFRDQLTKLNEVLEKEAITDKAVRSEIEKLQDPEPLLEELESLQLIRYPKSRLRMKKTAKHTKQRVQPEPAKTLESVFKNRGFEVIADDDVASADTLAIEVRANEKQVIIRENHPSFKEYVTVLNESFEVNYEDWKATPSLDSACKIQGTKVTFNPNHPVFQLNLDVEVLKKLIVGVIITVDKNPRRSELCDQFYRLLMDMF
ncbi:MAG: ATP-binding protein [Nitrososphaerota archaeon]|nr:ATP-binding protein [Nitrososphaerota archaeon]